MNLIHFQRQRLACPGAHLSPPPSVCPPVFPALASVPSPLEKCRRPPGGSPNPSHPSSLRHAFEIAAGRESDALATPPGPLDGSFIPPPRQIAEEEGGGCQGLLIAPLVPFGKGKCDTATAAAATSTTVPEYLTPARGGAGLPRFPK